MVPLGLLWGGGGEGEVIVREWGGRGGKREACALLVVVVVAGRIHQHVDRTTGPVHWSVTPRLSPAPHGMPAGGPGTQVTN